MGGGRIVLGWVETGDPVGGFVGNVRVAVLNSNASLRRIMTAQQGAHVVTDTMGLLLSAQGNMLATYHHRSGQDRLLGASRYDLASDTWSPIVAGAGLTDDAEIGGAAGNEIGDYVIVWPDATGHAADQATLRSRLFE